MRPIRNILHISVFCRVPMDVIKMPFQVMLIPDDVIPKSMLPQGGGLRNFTNFFVVTGEIALEGLQDGREIGGIVLEPHQPMKMIGQDDVNDELKWEKNLEESHGFMISVESRRVGQNGLAGAGDIGDEYNRIGDVEAMQGAHEDFTSRFSRVR